MIKDLQKYRKAKAEYFKQHPTCEFPGCTVETQLHIHHKRGRGAFLSDKKHFSALCFAHHRWVEENPLEAMKMGLVESRLSI